MQIRAFWFRLINAMKFKFSFACSHFFIEWKWNKDYKICEAEAKKLILFEC